MAHESVTTYRLTDVNTYFMEDENTYIMVDSHLPDKWETLNPDTSFIGGRSLPRIKRTSSTPRIGGSGGVT